MMTLIKHRMIWAGRDPKEPLVPRPLPWGIKNLSRIYTIRNSTSTAKLSKYFDLAEVLQRATERAFAWKHN